MVLPLQTVVTKIQLIVGETMKSEVLLAEKLSQG